MVEGRNFWELVERRSDATPDARLAVDEQGSTLTFRDYKARAEKVAAGLAGLGVTDSTTVSWELPTWLESLVLVAALSRIGAIQNPIIPIYRAREVAFVTRQAQSRLLLVPSVWRGFDYEAMATEIARSIDGLDVLVCDHWLPEGDPSTLHPPPPPPASLDNSPIRWLFYTSGTTADPKGARHTDATVMAAAAGMNRALELEAEDSSALVFPFTHIGGIIWLVSCLMAGCRLLVVEAFDPASTVPLMAAEGVTLAGAGTPFHMAYLAEQRKNPRYPLFERVRAFPGGAAPKPPQLHHDLKAEMGGAGVVSGYGLTECPILSMGSVRDPDDKLAHTEGRTTPGIAVRVVTLEGKLATLGEEGEIRVKGPQLFQGYLDSSLDSDAFDEEGFFRTGDLGFQDADGFIVITGRLKDVIIRKGENISAKELEDLLYEHPKVSDVAVIGLPDPQTGERCCAIVALTDPNEPLEHEEMVSFLLRKNLMIQKIPEQLETVSELPRNPSGKVLKHKLREQFAST